MPQDSHDDSAPDSRLEPKPDPKARPLNALLSMGCDARVEALYSESGAAEWGVSRGDFEAALERSAAKRFSGGMATLERLEEFLATLYVEDLGLACGCTHGSAEAWEYFVREYRGYLRASAEAMTKGGRGGVHAQELADSLFAELYGLADGKRGERSLFRYFHGRSSLKTWLRAILAQRHVDRIRETRRWESLDDPEKVDGDGKAPQIPNPPTGDTPLDPYRQKYLSCFAAAFDVAIRALESTDRQRLELYYAKQKKLAEIGRFLGEHESSVSRSLERIRRELRAKIEECLSKTSGLSDAEITLCFQYAAEDVPLDFRNVFPAASAQKPSGEQGGLQ